MPSRKWQMACKQALIEPDPEKLFLRVIVAETAIFHRLHDPASMPDNTELKAMDSMLKNLQRLIAVSFTFSLGEEQSATGPLRAPHNPFRPGRMKRPTQPAV